MARIPEAEVERLRQEISLVRLIEEAGLALEQRGKDYAARCPFHADETASLIVTPAKNLYHCFGCGAAGGPIDWVMKHRGVSFRHAVELLREGSPTLPAEVVKRSTVRTLPAPVSLDADDRVLLGQVADYYHQTLKETPDALAYLEARGLRHPELILRFKLGFANRTLGLRLPEKNRKSGAEARRRLERIGIMRESGHEHFTGSLVVPIVDDAGNVVELYGRKIRNDLRKGTPLHLYLPGPHAGTWNLDGLAGSGGEVILCEALIDAMTFWCAGYRNVTSAYGVEGLTEDHLAAFARYAVRRVLIAFDRDEAGERGAAKVAERLKAAGIECYRIEFSKGLDANAYALKVTPASKSLGVLIRSAVWLGQGQAPERGPVPVAVPEPASAEPDIVPLAAKEELPPAPSLPAARVPEGPREIPAAVSEAETVMSFGDRRWRIRGLARNLAYDVLKINLLAGCGEAFHVDTLDLYNARARAGFVTQAAIELQVGEAVLKADLGRVLLKLEALQEAAIREAAAPKAPAAVAMDEIERQAALDLLRTPDLPGRILADFAACGIVGESTNKLVGYLAAVSRKLAAPLAVVIQSSSAAGKSSLMDAVLAFMPEEDRTQYSAMTGQSLFYMGETSLKHRILAIAEEAGAARASYALKLLQSEGGGEDISQPGQQQRTREGHERERPGTDRAFDRNLHAEQDQVSGRIGPQDDAAQSRRPAVDARNRLADDDHDGDRRGRGTAQSLPGADGRRGSRADAGDPPAAAGEADLGRADPAGSAAIGAGGASQRAAPVAAAGRGQSLCRSVDLPGRSDADPARSREIPDLDRCDCPAAPAPAGGPQRGGRGPDHRLRRGDAGGYRAG